ncbi:and LDL-receptor class A domain-containing 2-like [Octopus vulgaris]|uniref:And LDL-receptor class A domain-containing 2-like n=1 Tax=Octopus vulgaris TaxID=6645 RepID=A0AA36B0X6_OCTVU|nr:and LDL-receptor class A domain-containing 2-like [Octopus vulgaris]
MELINSQHVCDFEKDLCDWNSHKSIDITWKRKEGKSNKHEAETLANHTTGSGSYLHLEYQNLTEKNVAQIFTPAFLQMDKSYCLSFYYYMSGKFDKVLYIYRYSNNTQLQDEEVIALEGSQDENWRLFQTSFKTERENRLMFEAHLEGPTSDISIDDVQLKEGYCPESNEITNYESLGNNTAPPTQLPFSCDLQDNVCGFKIISGILKWRRGHGRRSYFYKGPVDDHTFRTRSGIYLYASVPSRNEKRAAHLVSPEFSGKDQICVQFWYNMYGRNINKLEVIIRNQTVWYAAGDQGYGWKVAYVSVLPGEDFNLVVEGIVGLNNTGGIAIDDFAMTSIKCKTTPSKANLQKPLVKTTRKSITPSHATIEPGKVVMNCNFLNNTCKWIQGHDDTSDWIRTQSKNFGGQGPIADHTSANGFYMNLPSNVGQTAHLHSQIITPVAGYPMCLSFWYYMYGPNIEAFKVYITKSNLKEKAPHWITFEGKVKQSTFGNIAIDDILLIHGTCNELTTRKPDISVPLAQRSCNFEANDICGFSVENTTDFRWSQHSGSTDTLGTGPTNDHTLESSSGHYMYVSAMDGNVTVKSSLISPFYKNTDSVCLKFYYHMYGNGIGTLNIYTKVGNIMDRIYHISGNQANKWQVDTATIDIAKTSKNLYRVIFEAVKGPNKRGDIALDDISFTLGACSVKGDCDFEDPNCLWTNVQGTGDNFDWIKLKGPASNTNTGPKFDHTLQNVQGHYQYIEKAKGNDPGRAWLVSPLFQPLTSDKCLQFWYNMNGKDISRLSVVITVAGSSNITIWQLEGNQGKAWLQGQVSLPRIKKPYSVVFEGINGKEQGGIALDDITFINEGCRIIPSKAYVKHSMTTVKPAATKAPVDVSTSCTFTKDYCGWKQDKSDDGDWLIGLSEKASMKDHTGDDVGHYIFVKHLNLPNKKFRLISPDFTPTSDTSCVTFWYYKYGYSSNSLRMYIKEGLNLPSSPVLAVVFEIRSDSFGITALDDVSITHGACKNDFSQSLSCDFENKDICGFQQDTHGKKPWVRHQGSTSTLNTGPLSDHTYRSNKGHQNSDWQLSSIQINSHKQYQIYFQAIVGGKYDGDIAIDDFTVRSGQCNKQGTCNFENGICDWEMSDENDFDWLIQKADVKSKALGPLTDHTNIKGKPSNAIAAHTTAKRSYTTKPATVPQTDSFKSCTFSTGFCGWQQLPGSKVKWQMKRGKTATQDTGPKRDHTTGKAKTSLLSFCDFESTCSLFQSVQSTLNWQLTTNTYHRRYRDHTYKSTLGDYIYVDLTKANKYSDARFNMPTIHNRTVCVEFFYRALGSFTGRLTVFRKVKDETLSLLKIEGNDVPNEWAFAELEVQSYGDLQLSFYVLSGKNPIGGIAIDDIAVANDHCKPPASCDFEKEHLCHWKNSLSNRHDWLVHSGGTDSRFTGPSADHTTGKPTGSYIYIEASNQRRNEKVRIVVIEGSTNSVRGDIAIDDIYTIPQSCSFFPSRAQAFFEPTTQSPATTTENTIETDVDEMCTFEKGMCIWAQSQTDQFEWKLRQGYTPNQSIGPQGDHTTGSGHYLYIDTAGQAINSRAQLFFTYTPIQNKTRCLKFWYNMRGQHVDYLNVYIQYGTGSNSPAWSRRSDQGPNWQLAQINFDEEYFTDMKIIIEGVKGGNTLSNIAIDDITLTRDGCKEPIGKCDFETRSLCGYQPDSSANFKWIWRTGYKSWFSTAPNKDHTYGSSNGHYMHISSRSPRKPKEVARLLSPKYDAPEEDHCVQFYYNIYGRNVGSLNIKLRIHDTKPYDTDSYLQIKGDQQKGWILGMVEVPKMIENPYQIIFEGVIGTGPYGDIAIDDITVTHGECEVGGFYLFIDATYLKQEDKSRYISQMFPALHTERRCFTFWYSMNGNGIGILKILTKFETGSNVTIWELSRDQGNKWLYGQAPIQSHTEYQIIIEATRGRTFEGDLAIDDIIFKDSDCSVLPHTAAPKDTNVVIPTGIPPKNTETTKPFNCSFDDGICGWTQDPQDDFDWSEMAGKTQTWGTGPSSDHGGKGHYLYIEASNKRNGQKARLVSPLVKSVGMIILEATRGRGNRGDIAIDDVAVNEGFCTRQAAIGSGKYYNFESRNRMDQMKDDDFDWKLGSGWEARHSSRPSKDHTFKTSRGHYMYIRGNSRLKPDDKAVMSTPAFYSQNSAVCVTFWYFLYGKASGSLMVQYVSEQDGFTSPKVIWMKNEDQGNQWNEANLNIDDHSGKHIRIEFVGIAGPGYSLNVAIDDVFVSNKPCTIKPDSCNFENGKCEWENKNKDDFDWVISSGKYTSLYGPSKDHTSSTTAGGYYMYVESSFFSGLLKHYADLISPTFSTTQKACISFYYHMFGENINSLRLILAPKKGSAKYIWLKNGPQKNKWLQGTVTIPAVSSSNIVFRGVSGFGSSGDIAIDDVTIHTGECQEDISSNAVDCDFESSDGCQYFQDKSVDYRWKKYSGYGSPFRDHTKKSVFGHFMGAGSRRISSGKKARLWTPQFALKDGQCLSFWYHMYGSRIGTLNVHVTNVNAVNRIGAAVWTRRGHQGRSWFEEYIPLPNFINAFVIFESINRGDIIGIDDIKLLNSTCPEPGDCHFEISSCGWHNDGNNTVNWERMSGRTIYQREHRYIRDHTYSSIASSMMYIGVSKSKMKTKGDLVSISFDKTSGSGLCIKFWYIIYGTNIGSLSVIMQTSNQSTLMWKLSDSQGSGWSQGTFFIKSDSSFTLSIRAEIEENANGFLALDDINYNSLRCAGPYDCTFESKNFCGWTQDQSNLKWIISKGSRYGYDPIVDHTLKTSNGNFALFRYKRTHSIQYVKLLSPPIHNYTLTCLSFWFHLYGNRVHSLSVQHMTSNKVFTQVWYHSQPLSRKWHPASITLGLNENDKIAFQVDSRSYLSGSVALDDIKLTPGHCQIKESCGFEDENLCEFVQMKPNANFYWKVRDEKAPPIDTQILPRYDHTEDSLTGHYMYLRNSHVRSGSARLFSKVQRKTSGSCVSFWYSIGGTSNSMRFRVYSLISDIYRNLWTRSSRTGKTWNQAEVTVKSNTHWQVAFLGYSTRFDKQSYIALDDVKITSGSCPMDGDCNFEKDMCSWSNSNQDNFDWLQTTAANNRAGPKVDHSEQTAQGSYIYVLPKWPIQTGEKAVLVSDPIAPVPRRRCMSFWYYMKGNSAGELEVGYANESVLWRISDDQGDKWHLGKVPLSITNRFKKMTISASAGAGSRSIIAIDEISFDLKPCGLYPINAKPVLRPSTPSAPTTPTSPPSTFKPNSKFDCSFENGFCSWGQSKNDIFNWTLQQGPTDSSGTGPNVDHTYGSKKGHYIYIESSYPRKRGDTAILTSASFSKNINYTLEFYYHMYGSTIGGLNVTMTLDGQQQSQLLWSQRRSQARAWIKAELSIPPQNVPFAISLVGIIGWSVYGDIAIDDIRVFTTEQTEAPLNCTFEASGICKFSTPSNGNYRWKKHTGIARYPSHAPSFDHTSGTPYGDTDFEDDMGTWSNVRRNDVNWIRATGQMPYRLPHPAKDHTMNSMKGNIDFEKGLTTWMNVIDDDFDWLIGTGKRYYNYDGPRKDHTLKTFYGHYLLLRALSPFKPGDHALLISESLDGSMHQCMRFWYRMSGQGIGTLRFIMVQLGSNVTSWVLSGSQSTFWRLGRFPIASNKPFQIIIEGVRGSSNRVNFAIDDIEFNNKKCSLFPRKATELPTTSTIPSSVTTALPPRTTPTPTQYDCTFEKDMCSWTNDVKADFKWARAQGPSGHYKSGPTTDHTSGTKDGWYILSKRSWRSKSYSKARIVGPSIPPSQTRCLNFWYHMYGAYVNQLQVNVTQGTTTKKLWVKTGDQGNLWRQAFIHMDKSAYKTNYKITFEAVGGINYRDFIALDDIRFTLGACHENNPTFCDFESEDKCNYTHNKNADFEWTWHHGRTQSSGTGPTADHTMGTPSGHYFYIETSSKKVNQTAQLISPMYHTDTPTCLHFYYFMYGEDINTLNIYQAFGNQFDELKSPLWNMEHSQGPNWIEGTVTLAAHGNYTVIFEGISGKGFRGDIAIDDVFQTNGSCQTPGFCDFENGPCNWRNDKLDDFDWVIGQGLTLTDQTGPIYDHTYNNAKGHYMYIDSSSPIRPGDVAHLLSEHLSANKKPGCLKFWYQMYGKDVNALNVLVRKSFGFLRHYDAAFIWTVNGNQGQKWFSAQVYIDPKYTGMSHQLIFEAIRGNGSYGDIAIDDISISQESCSIKPIYADPQKSELQEVSCSFDMSFCQWYLDSKSDFNWTLAGYYKRIKPRTGSGSYIYIKSFQSKKGSNAMIHTTLLAPTSTGGNCMSFWYYMYGSNIGTLNVYMTKFGRKVLIWTKRGSQENQWNYAHLNVENDYNFMLYIEFVTNGRSTGMVAVDDIFMDTNGCPHPRSCDFEVDTCGWTIESILTNLWKKSTYFSQIPDHTTGTKSGHYVYASSSRYGRRRTKIARLTSPPFPPASQSCLRFWYNMNVQNSSALQLYVKTGFFKRQVWERTGNQGKEWWQGHANIVVPLQQLGVTYKLTFQSVQDGGHSEIIAVDDIEHLPGPCDPQGLCDFEQGMCGFTNVYGDDFDWIVFSGSKQSFVSGPTEDHTTNSPSGHYMYIDTRFNRNENDRAWLSSWENEPTNATCMGDLNVFYKNSQSNRTIWHLSGNQGNIWLLGNFTIISPTTYVIIFEGVRGKTYTSDIALDDIRFQNGTCESIVTVPTTTVAPVKRDIFFQCTFEYGLCGWQIDSTTNAEFMISYGVFIYKRGGPRSDHTLGNHFGHYLLLNNSQSTTNRTARFISTDIHITRPICITFWYYMRITNFGQLNVYVHNNGEKKPPIWTRSGTQGYYWLHASIDVANPEKSNKVYFEAIRNHGYYGIALDDIKILIGSCPEINECDFEEVDICGFEQGTTDKFNWTRGSRSTARRSGPQSDHTYKSFYGHYMYLNMQKHTKDDHAHLYTPQYPATQTERCLSFWYYMDGTYEDKINVYLYQNNKITTRLWSIQTSQGPHWRLATVSINSQTPFQVLFEGIRGYNSRVIIALDDVKVSQTACEPLASCNFEEGFCGWFNNRLTIGHSMNWVIRTGHYRRTKLEPPIDHTAGDSSGSYAHIYSSKTSNGRAAYLESQMVPYEESPRFCFHFWHYMYGTDAGLLTVYVHYHGRSLKAIWTRNNTISHQWVEEHVTVGSQYINFEMVIGSIAGSNGSIAIDDVMLMKGLCPNEQEEKFTCKSGQKISKEKVCDFIFDCPDYDDEDNCGSCSFEDDMCTWTDISHGSFEWVRGRNGNNITESGPSIDHTMGTANGWFAYIHSSNGTRTRYASLENRVIQQTSSTCELNFWYYISSTTSFANNINVVLHESDITTLLIRYASRSNVWQQATVAIGKVSRPFRLVFYGTRSLSGRSDVAIDDISLTDCNFPKAEEHCEKYEFHCKNKACIDSSQVCDLSNDCGDGSDEGDCDDFNSCDFDFGLCDWSQDWNDDFDWTRTNGETLSYSTGPKRDHSTGTGTGYYIYTEASYPRKKGENARLYSPVIAPTSSNECWIRFFYHMNGFQMGTLNVYTRTSVLGKYKKLWTKTGHVADYWERADVKLTSNQKFQVVFESIIGGFSSDIALDDITFLPGCDISNNNEKLPNGTEPKTTPNPCPIGLYACRDRTGCIQYTNVCDFEKNCNDNSDEDVCGDCDFESGLCGWTDYSTGKFKWASHQGDAMGKIGPANDHTTNSITGKYMRVFPNSGIFPTPAVISTRPYGETGKHCVIQFYVFLSGDDIGVLNLNMIDPVTGKLLKNLYSQKKNLGNAWVKESVKIGAHKRGFSLQFQALPETHSKPFTITTDIAVDDLKLINCDPAPIRIYTTPTTTSGKHSKTTPGKHIKTTPGNHTTSKPGKTTSSSSGRISTTTTTASTTPPIKCNPDEFSCRTQNGFECFPTAYHCDGRKDCLNGEDEKSCKACPKGYTYCKPQHKCINSTRCNGISDCEDNSDESLCQTCRPDMCQKGGPCQVKDGIPQCSCGNLTVQTNFRCLIPKFERITSHPSHKKTWAIPFKMSEIEPPSFSNTAAHGDSTAIENPLYSDLK